MNVESLREMEGLSIIFGNSVDDTSNVAQNSLQGKSDFKGGMGYAKKLTRNNFKRVASIPTGTDKYIKSNTFPGFFRGDDSFEIKNNKSWFASYDGWLYVILGNSALNWREAHYGTRKFTNGLPIPSNDIAITPDGWAYATVAKLWDGVDDVSNNWMTIRDVTEDFEEFINLKSGTKTSQAVSICGSGNEQRTGTCCLYHKEPTYDSVIGVTYDAGDFYKCIGTQCYKCLEYAKALDKDYIFNKFTGGIGPTGGTGEMCIGCDCENYPYDCGPCSCSIGNRKKYDVINSDINLSIKGIAKQNAKFANQWDNVLSNKIFVSLTPEFEKLSPEQRKISASYRGKEKRLSLIGNATTDAHITLATEGNKENEEFVVGLVIQNYGSGYEKLPTIDFDALSDIWADAQSDYLRVTQLPDLHSNISELVGGTQPMIKVDISLSDIANATDITSFSSYAIGVQKTEDGSVFFPESTTASTDARLTHKNVYTKTASPLAAMDLVSKASNVYKFSGKFGTVATSKTKGTNQLNTELFRTNSTDVFNNDFTDENGTEWQFVSEDKPADSITGKKFDPQKTDILHVNKTTLNIPVADKIKNNLISSSVSIEIIFAAGAGSKS